MKRIALITLVLIAAAWLAVAGTGAGDGGTYEVRAIFTNAGFAIPGEDVRIAGVNVGTIESVDLTAQNDAAIVLGITDDGFKDFRTDARCIVRPQSLIGDRYVECIPTEPRPPGATQPPELPTVADGPGKGQHLLPVSHTTTPVDLDLINDIWRLPYRQRLSIILSEFGTGLAGNGTSLREAIRRSNPALEETDKVLKILAKQNKVLADLASNSDTVLAPLARDREHVADFIVQANTVNQATASEGDALERNLELLPPFLRQLTPTMQRLGGVASAATPVFQNLNPVASDINHVIENLTPLGQAAIPALTTLGTSAAPLQADLEAFNPRITNLANLTTEALPVTTNLSKLLTSLKTSGGVEQLLRFLFYSTTVTNGYDQYSHYLRAALLVNLCSDYATAPRGGCSANFQTDASASSAALTPTQQVIAGADPQRVLDEQAAAAKDTPQTRETAAKLTLPKIALPGRLGSALGSPAETAPTPPKAATGTAAPQDPRTGLFDYLLGPES